MQAPLGLKRIAVAETRLEVALNFGGTVPAVEVQVGSALHRPQLSQVAFALFVARKLIDRRCAVCAAANGSSPGHRLPGEKVWRLPGFPLGLPAHRHVAWNGCTVHLHIVMT